MTVKFIVSGDKVIFGNLYYNYDSHAEIAKRAGVPKNKVNGGGLADPDNARIFGTSHSFGPYNVQQLQQLLPDWNVEPPSAY